MRWRAGCRPSTALDHERRLPIVTGGALGNEAANEAFCASVNPPNPTFGPHPIFGNINVRP